MKESMPGLPRTTDGSIVNHYAETAEWVVYRDGQILSYGTDLEGATSSVSSHGGMLSLWTLWSEDPYNYWTDRGPSRSPKPGKSGVVVIRRLSDDYSVGTRAPYSDAKLQEIIEQGRSEPRYLDPDTAMIADRARAEASEDLRAVEQQFAGIGTSGSYGSLDGRNSRRSKSGSGKES